MNCQFDRKVVAFISDGCGFRSYTNAVEGDLADAYRKRKFWLGYVLFDQDKNLGGFERENTLSARQEQQMRIVSRWTRTQMTEFSEGVLSLGREGAHSAKEQRRAPAEPPEEEAL